MDRTEFFRRQADRFSKLAKECADEAVSAKLNTLAAEYRDMLDGRASDDSKDRPVAHEAASLGVRPIPTRLRLFPGRFHSN